MTSYLDCTHGNKDKPYCFECVQERAAQRCLDKQEGWRWGLAVRDPATGKDVVDDA